MTTLRLINLKPDFIPPDDYLEVTLDRELFFQGTFSEGFDRSVATSPGTHKLETRLGRGQLMAKGLKGMLHRFANSDIQSFAQTKSYEVTLVEGQSLVATLRYSRFWNNFKGSLDVEVIESTPYR